MKTAMFLLALCALVQAAPAPARQARDCVEAPAYYRRYHPVEGADPATPQATVFDEIAVCRAAGDTLSFSLSTRGEKGGSCYVDGKAKPRQQGVYLFLEGGFALRLVFSGDRLSINESSKPEEAARYCSGQGSIGSMDLRLHSGRPPK